MLMRHFDLKNIGNGKLYAAGWKGIHCPTAGEAAKVITKYAWSPCLWAGGIRKKANFRCAMWLALDFDEGLSIDEAKETFANHLHIIGTTRNHRVEKNGVVADRFRVLLKASEVIRDRLVYEETMRALCARYHCDPAAKDAARLFWPCNHVESLQYHGMVVAPVDVSQARESLKAWDRFNKQTYSKDKLPPWILKFMREGIPSGQRNDTTFRIAKELSKLEFSCHEVSSLIAGSNIPSEGFTVREIERTVFSAFT